MIRNCLVECRFGRPWPGVKSQKHVSVALDRVKELPLRFTYIDNKLRPLYPRGICDDPIQKKLDDWYGSGPGGADAITDFDVFVRNELSQILLHVHYGKNTSWLPELKVPFSGIPEICWLENPEEEKRPEAPRSDMLAKGLVFGFAAALSFVVVMFIFYLKAILKW